MNAELFEDQPQCNISPLYQSISLMSEVSLQTEIKPNCSPIHFFLNIFIRVRLLLLEIDKV